jgi:hypothetical protein
MMTLIPADRHLGYSIWNSSSWRINHAHEANKPQVLQRKVGIISIKWVAFWETFSGSASVTETQHSFTQTSQFQVGFIEGIFPFLSQLLIFSIDCNTAAPL